MTNQPTDTQLLAAARERIAHLEQQVAQLQRLLNAVSTETIRKAITAQSAHAQQMYAESFPRS